MRPNPCFYIDPIQDEHHKSRTFVNELKALVEASHMIWKPKHLP